MGDGGDEFEGKGRLKVPGMRSLFCNATPSDVRADL